MLKKIGLHQFKAFRQTDLDLRSLNLLTGSNGTGKSSVIQALLLLRQSYQAYKLPEEGLILRGDLSLGRSIDVLYANAKLPKILFDLDFGFENIFRFAFEAKNGELLPILKEESVLPTAEQVKSSSLFGTRFQYLGADREIPRHMNAMNEVGVKSQHSLGFRGEFAAHFLSEYGRNRLAIPSLKPGNVSLDTIALATEGWLSMITGDVKLSTEMHPGFDSVSLRYQFVAGEDLTNKFSPVNVGFGYTYVLPVLLAVLAARPGDLVVIENPESHLHPRGQAKLGELFAIAAANGVQLIVESHSDHIFNGIRVAVKKGLISCSDVGLFYFERNQANSSHETIIMEPELDENGRVSAYPIGFFDESDRLLDQLLD